MFTHSITQRRVGVLAGGALVAGAAIFSAAPVAPLPAASATQVQHDVALSAYFDDLLNSISYNPTLGSLLTPLSTTDSLEDVVIGLGYNPDLSSLMAPLGALATDDIGLLLGGIDSADVLGMLSLLGITGAETLTSLLGSDLVDLLGLTGSMTLSTALTGLLGSSLDELIGDWTLSDVAGGLGTLLGVDDLGDLLGFGATDAMQLGDYLDLLFGLAP